MVTADGPALPLLLRNAQIAWRAPVYRCGAGLGSHVMYVPYGLYDWAPAPAAAPAGSERAMCVTGVYMSGGARPGPGPAATAAQTEQVSDNATIRNIQSIF